MADDGIEYMGRWPALPPLPARPFLSSSQELSGIVLHIERSDIAEASQVVFNRADTAVVHVGRRPETDRRKKGPETGKAMFRSPVVSRNHAKITFSDAGNVYLIDLGSHHGTYVRKINQATSRKLVQETPCLLGDGDIVTFGKTVTKDVGPVRPVVARVEFLHNSPSSSLPLFSSLKRSSFTSISPSTPPPTDLPGSPKSGGRYGVHAAPSVSSSSDDFSDRINDSDIEEVPAPDPSLTLHPRPSFTFERFKRFVPSFVSFTSPPEYVRSKSPDSRSASPRPASEIVNLGGGSDSPSLASHRMRARETDVIGFDAYSNDVFEDNEHLSSRSRSRSTSPMIFSSPSVSPQPQMRSSTPPRQSLPAAIPNIWEDELALWNDAFSDPVLKEPVPAPPAVPSEPVEEPKKTDVSHDVPAVQEELAELRSLVTGIKTDIDQLNTHRRKIRTRFNSNVTVVTDKLSDIDTRLADLNAMHTALRDQLDTVLNYDIMDIQAELEGIQRRLPDSRHETPDKEVERAEEALSGHVMMNALNLQAQIDLLRAEMELAKPTPNGDSPVDTDSEVKAQTMEYMEDLHTEITTLRNTAREQIRADMEIVQSARAAAMEMIAAAQAEIENQSSSLTSLKRKRSDDQGEDEVPQEVDSRPTKRVRTIASAIGRTAAAVTVGAVVTWTALAFS